MAPEYSIGSPLSVNKTVRSAGVGKSSVRTRSGSFRRILVEVFRCQIEIIHEHFQICGFILIFSPHTVKVSHVPSRDVTNQTLPGRK
jgi:hypothetical protein